MRTVTFSDASVAKFINEGFVATWVNRNPKFHNCEVDTEVNIARMSGEAYATRNFATFFATPDLDVLHYAAGYYRPAWFLPEAEFALALCLQAYDAEMKPKKDFRSVIAKLHDEHSKEHKAQDKKVRGLKCPSKDSDEQARMQANATYLSEALNYLHQLHGWFAKAARAGKSPKLPEVIKGYIAPNVFTEE